MKFVFKNYQFENTKINRTINCAVFSDIHFSNKTNINELYQINEVLKKKRMDYIFIPGDIVDNNRHLKDDSRRNLYLDWYKSLGKIAKTIISLGNHDFDAKDKKIIKHDDFLKSLNNIENIYLLDNDYYEDENIHVFGFTSTHDEKKDLANINYYIEELNNQNVNLNHDKYKILMCHSPLIILQEEVYKKLNIFEDLNLVLCGHMHNGMLPPFMDKIFKGNWGIISPYKSFFPNCSRGVLKRTKNKKEVTIIISGSICKLSKSSNIFGKFNKLYPAAIEFIEVLKR